MGKINSSDDFFTFLAHTDAGGSGTAALPAGSLY